MFNSLRLHGLQYARPPCPLPFPGVCLNSCSLSWCAIQSSHLLLSPSSPFPASSIFPSIRVFSKMSQLFASAGQSIGASTSASVLPLNIQNWFILGLTGLISLQSKGLSRAKGLSFEDHSSKASILSHSAFFLVQLSHPYMTTGKTIGLTLWTFVSQVMSLLFNILSRLVMAFLPRSKCLLISCLHSPFAVILDP